MTDKLSKDYSEQIFYCEKSDWYDEVEGKRDWSKSLDKVDEFWRQVRREKMAKLDYNFVDFIFPIFSEQNFWKEGQEREFSVEGSSLYNERLIPGIADFYKAQFYGLTDFSEVTFQGEAYFSECCFYGHTDYSDCSFESNASFSGSLFMAETDFSKSSSKGIIGFKKASFNKPATFQSFSALCALFEEVKFDESTFNDCSIEQWIDFEKSRFRGPVTFDEMKSNSAHFGEALFEDQFSVVRGSIEQWMDFKKASFNGKAFFDEVEVGHMIKFDNASFKQRTSFAYALVNGPVTFLEVIFEDNVNFDSAAFRGATFDQTIFNCMANFAEFKSEEWLTFFKATFTDNVYFDYTVFQGKFWFQNCICKEQATIEFYRTFFSTNDRCLFNNWKLEELVVSKKREPRIQFVEVIFTDKVEFLKCDFSRVVFENGDLTKAKFSNCAFVKRLKRTYFINEAFRYDKEKQSSRLVQRIEHLKMIGEIYRQFKRNQMEAKNWREAGDSYRSEMIMNRKLQLLEFRQSGNPSRLLNLLVIWIHGALSAYQQSIARPLFILFLTWVLFGGIYYLLGYPGNSSDYYDGLSLFDPGTLLDKYEPLIAAFVESSYAMFQLSGAIDEEVPNHIKQLMVAQRFFAGVLLVFFGIATRARLKQ